MVQVRSGFYAGSVAPVVVPTVVSTGSGFYGGSGPTVIYYGSMDLRWIYCGSSQFRTHNRNWPDWSILPKYLPNHLIGQILPKYV